mmetsp:Transcript_68717/g.194689  ORF Transcript_68717/g.194689 Transcript_68717/m.194689 type:complete len:207 (-) Transcript_68717:35-655(-)
MGPSSAGASSSSAVARAGRPTRLPAGPRSSWRWPASPQRSRAGSTGTTGSSPPRSRRRVVLMPAATGHRRPRHHRPRRRSPRRRGPPGPRRRRRRRWPRTPRHRPREYPAAPRAPGASGGSARRPCTPPSLLPPPSCASQSPWQRAARWGFWGSAAPCPPRQEPRQRPAVTARGRCWQTMHPWRPPTRRSSAPWSWPWRGRAVLVH